MSIPLELDAIAAVVASGGGKHCRNAVARAVRSWRRQQAHSRARWLLRHVQYIAGHLWKG